MTFHFSRTLLLLSAILTFIFFVIIGAFIILILVANYFDTLAPSSLRNKRLENLTTILECKDGMYFIALNPSDNKISTLPLSSGPDNLTTLCDKQIVISGKIDKKLTVPLCSQGDICANKRVTVTPYSVVLKNDEIL